MDNIKKDVEDPKEFVTPVKDKVDALEKKIPAIERRVDDHDKDIKDIRAELAQMKSEIAKCLRWYMVPIMAALFGIVGIVYIIQGRVFRDVTQISYGVGLLGGSIVAFVLYQWYKSKQKN